MRRDRLVILLLVVFILSIAIQTVFVTLSTITLQKQIDLVGKVIHTGTVSFCINYQPRIINDTCPDRIREGISLNCSLIYNDSDPNQGHFFRATNSSTNPPLFMHNQTGELNITTYSGITTNYSHLLKIHRFHIAIEDNSTCSNYLANGLYDLEFEIYDKNDPPYLNKTIENKVINPNEDMFLLNLNDYFKDPDVGQVLRFEQTGGTSILLTILSDGRVIAYSEDCVTETFSFTAYDPYNLSATSNEFDVKVECDSGTQDASTNSGSSSSGGGGGSNYPSILCTSKWECTPWSKCQSDGTQSKRCYDAAGCTNRDHWFYQNCTYVAPVVCEEDWTCNQWGECQPDGTETRSCTEQNNCGTEESKPTTIRNCDYVATCNDGIQNQGETGVDCGGPCLPCKTLETPNPIDSNKTNISIILLAISFTFLSLLLIYKYFHKSINVFVLSTLLKMIEKRKKLILIGKKQSKEILSDLTKIERSIRKKNIKKKATEISFVGRKYLSYTTNLDIIFKKEMLQKIKIKDPLKGIFISLSDRLEFLETTKTKLYKTDLLLTIEEIREILRLTSNSKVPEEGVVVEEMEMNNSESIITTIKKQVYNTYISMHFDQLEISKQKYSEIMKEYEELDENKKGIIYQDLNRLFEELKYAISIKKG